MTKNNIKIDDKGLWFKEWFESHSTNYQLEKFKTAKSDKELKKELWKFCQFFRNSAYQKGRLTGIDYAIRKYGLKQNIK